jgi:hypothetical protein
VPPGEEPRSLFEPHTQAIIGHRAGNPVDFGCKARLNEVEDGIISGRATVG